MYNKSGGQKQRNDQGKLCNKEENCSNHDVVNVIECIVDCFFCTCFFARTF